MTGSPFQDRSEPPAAPSAPAVDVRADGARAEHGDSSASRFPRPLAAIADDLRRLHAHRHVLRNFVVSQLKVRYQRSVLGFCWTLLNPILMMTVLSLVFSQVFNRPLRDYAVYLFSGMVPWQFFAACVESGSRSLITHEYLIRKVSVQKLVFPLSDVLVAGANMCFAMAALFLVLQVLRPGAHAQLVLLPPAIAMLAAFSLGVALVGMTLVTYFRDFEHMIGVFLQAFYFACPILYTPEMVGRWQGALRWNPMTHLLGFFQDAFYYGRWPSAASWLAAVGSAAAALAAGYAVYKAHEDDYIFRL